MDKKRILIIDDDQNVIRTIKDLLEQWEYEIFFSNDGDSGFDKIGLVKPDLILLDLVLPEQSGFKVAQRIKASPKFSNIPIIAISLKREDIDKHIAVKSGISDYLEKPLDLNKLLYSVKDLARSNSTG